MRATCAHSVPCRSSLSADRRPPSPGTRTPGPGSWANTSPCEVSAAPRRPTDRKVRIASSTRRLRTSGTTTVSVWPTGRSSSTSRRSCRREKPTPTATTRARALQTIGIHEEILCPWSAESGSGCDPSSTGSTSSGSPSCTSTMMAGRRPGARSCPDDLGQVDRTNRDVSTRVAFSWLPSADLAEAVLPTRALSTRETDCAERSDAGDDSCSGGGPRRFVRLSCVLEATRRGSAGDPCRRGPLRVRCGRALGLGSRRARPGGVHEFWCSGSRHTLPRQRRSGRRPHSGDVHRV